MNFDFIRQELTGLYGQRVTEEMSAIIRLYAFYDGDAQVWPVESKDAAGYEATRIVTNLTRKLINDEARFMTSRPPEIRFDPEDVKDAENAAALEGFIASVLEGSRWQRRIAQAARDCFIGKRVALKLSGGPGRPLKVRFFPSLEFVYEVDENDADTLRKVIFFYQEISDETDRSKQRIWRQKYWMENGKCLLDEGKYDGYGNPIEITHENEDTGLDFIPVYVIVNDGLSGDLSGESDVEALIKNQDAYNHMKSDDVDALKFNMFPQKYFTDASQASMDKVIIAPNAMIDLATDPSAQGRQAAAGVLEPTFNYDARFENAINRIKSDMHALISVPDVTLEQLQGTMASGKAMRAIYWPLICRCEEKWAEWDDALRWMVKGLIKMAGAYGTEALPEFEYSLRIEHLYPIPDDEEDERDRDLREVSQQARSRQSYITKWQKGADADGELKLIAQEQALLQDAFAAGVEGELRTM